MSYGPWNRKENKEPEEKGIKSRNIRQTPSQRSVGLPTSVCYSFEDQLLRPATPIARFTSSTAVATTSTSFVTTSVGPHRLTKTDDASVLTFSPQYDQYIVELKERANQLVSSGTVTTEAVSLVNLKFCDDPAYLESAMELSLNQNMTYIEELVFQDLRGFLVDEAYKRQ